MTRLNLRFVFRAALALVLGLGLSSCSQDARRARHVAKAQEYVAAGEFDKAEIEFKNARQIAPRDPQAMAGLGMLYFDQGRIGQSSMFLREAAKLDAANLDVRIKLGYLSLVGGNRDEARAAAAAVLEQRPKDPEAPLLLADAVAQAKDAAEAVALLEKLASASPSAAVHTALGAIRLKQRNLDGAEAHLKNALAADPKFAAAHSAMGGLYLARKDTAQAERSFSAAAEHAPARSGIRLQWATFNLQTGKADAGKRILDDMIRATPDFLPPYILRASIAQAEKKPDESLGFLDKVLAREPLHPEALLHSSQVRLSKGETDKAIEILTRAAQIYGKSPQVHHHLGNAYLVKGELDNAAASFGEAVSLAQEYAPGVLGLANVQIRQRNFDAAVSGLKAFLLSQPGSADAQILLAQAYRQQGNPAGALAIYRQLSGANPQNAQLQVLVGATLLQQNNRAEARQAFMKAVQLAPDLLIAQEQLVNLDVAEKKFADAEARLTGLAAKTPANAAIYALLSRVHLAQGQKDKAIQALEKVIELQPEAANAYASLAQLYLETNQADKALESFLAVAAKQPNHFSALVAAGTLQEQKKDYPAARASYEKALAINPKATAALNNLAYLMSEQFSDTDKALEYAQRARETGANPAETGDTLGWIMFRRGQYARATALLDESTEKLQNHPEARYHLGMARYMMGDEAAARDELSRALELSSTFAGAREARESLALLSIDPQTADDAALKSLYQALERRKDDPVALSRLAMAHEKKGELDQAIARYESILKANPANANAAVQAVRLYQQKGEKRKALELAQNSRKLAPSHGPLAHALGRAAFENGEYLLAAGSLREASRILSDDPQVAFDLGEAVYSLGQVEAAEAAFQAALAAQGQFPRASLARDTLAFIAATQNPAQAKDLASKAEQTLKADPTHVPALMVKAAADEQNGNHAAARQAYEKALVKYPEFAPAKRKLAIHFASHPEDDRKALELATKSREVYPSDPSVAKALGIILYRQGTHARAASLLEESARSLSRDAEVQYYLGLAQQKLKDVAGSKKSLEKAIELGLSEKLASDAKRVLASLN